MAKTLIHAVVLGGFSMATAALLAGGNLVTAPEIELRQSEDLQTSLSQVLPARLYDNKLLADALSIAGGDGTPVKVYRGLKAGAVTGVAYEIAGNGYGGEVRLILGLDAEGKILGVRPLKHSETPGLGDKVDPAKTDWITRFTGRSLGDPDVEKWKVKKDGGDFDQFSGATITPRAVVGAIRGGLQFFAAHKAEILGPAPTTASRENP
ncbi:MAG: electron transport complex subunit RsxG [Azospirillum sp.]|nr:electron transport complex subunit RsxG [Azospirillum sp.]